MFWKIYKLGNFLSHSYFEYILNIISKLQVTYLITISNMKLVLFCCCLPRAAIKPPCSLATCTISFTVWHQFAQMLTQRRNNPPGVRLQVKRRNYPFCLWKLKSRHGIQNRRVWFGFRQNTGVFFSSLMFSYNCQLVGRKAQPVLLTFYRTGQDIRGCLASVTLSVANG